MNTIALNNVRNLDPERFESRLVYFVPRDELLDEYRAVGITPICLNHAKPSDGLRTIARASRLLRDFQIDLVHTNHPLDSLYLAMAAWPKGIPVVSTLHHTKTPEPLFRNGAFTRALSRTGVVAQFGRRITNHYVAVSDTVREEQIKHLGIPAERITTIYSGIDFAPFLQPHDSAARAERERALGIQHRHPILLNVGRLHAQKGQSYLIPMMVEVVRHYPNAVLVIIGEGSERRSLELAIAESRLQHHIRLAGRRPDVPQLLRLADAFVFPALGKEGLGLAVVEAALAGLPIIASHSVEEVVGDGRTGVLVPAREPLLMAAALLELLADPVQARRLGETARIEAMKRFSLDSAVEKLEEVYLTLLADDRTE